MLFKDNKAENNKSSKNDNIAKTGLYQNNNSNNTGLYSQNNNINGTGTYSSEYESKDILKEKYKSSKHNLGIGDNINLNGNEYNIIDIISEFTGEAEIFKIKDKEGKCFVLKLYFEFRNYKEEPNSETLKRIKTIFDEDILRLYDFGTEEKKYQGKYCYEISDFAEGGDLLSVNNLKDKYSYSFIKSNVVPEIFKGIKRLHDNHIYHCDLKPQNIFYLNKEQTDLVIGDYGSAKSYNIDDGKEVHITSTVKGTNAYIPAEQGVGTITDKNDYFSFGMILLHLLYPEDFARDDNLKLFDKKKVENIRELQNIGLPIIEFNPAYSDLNNLIAGLTLDNKHDRWGRKEVEMWFKGEAVEIKYKNLNEITPIKLGKVTIRTSEELISYIERNVDWYNNLIEDKEGYSSLLLWFTSIKNLEEKKIFDSMIKYYKQDGKGYIKEAVIRYFQPNRAIVVDMSKYNFFEYMDLKKNMSNVMTHIDNIWKQNRIKDIKFILFQTEFCLRQIENMVEGKNNLLVRSLLEMMYSTKGLKFIKSENNLHCIFYPVADDNCLIKLFHAFNSNRNFRDLLNKDYNSIEEVGIYFAKNIDHYENPYLKLEREEYNKKIDKNSLIKLNIREFLFNVFAKEIKTYINVIEVRTKNLKNRGFEFRYQFSRSLTEYFAKNNIKYVLDDNNYAVEYTYINNKRLFKSFNYIVNDFLVYFSNEHNIPKELVTDDNLLEIKRKLKKAIFKSYKIISLIIVNLIFLTIGYFLSYYLLKLADKKINPFLMEDYFYSDFSVSLFVVAFFFLAMVFLMRAQKAIKITYLYLLLTLITFFAYSLIFSEKYNEAKHIFSFRKGFKALNTEIDKFYLYRLFSTKDQYNTIKKEISSSVKTYDSFINCDLKGGYLSIFSRAPILKRTFTDVNSISKSTTVFSEMGNEESNNLTNEAISLGISYFIAPLHSYKFNNFIPIKINFRVALDNDKDLARVGIKINKYVLLISKDSVEFQVLRALKEIKKEDLNLKHKYFIVTGGPKKGNYAENYKTRDYNNDSPIGLSYNASEIEKSGSSSYIQKDEDFQNVTLILLKDKLLVEINGKLVMEKEIKWDLDKDNYGDDLKLYFEPNASFRFDDIMVASLWEIESDEIKNKYEDVKFMAITCFTKGTTRLLKNNFGNDYYENEIAPNQRLEVLYREGDFYKVRNSKSKNIGYLIDTLINNIQIN